MNTNILIHPCKLSGKIPLHPSKSYLHRIIIASYLACNDANSTHAFNKRETSLECMATLNKKKLEIDLMPEKSRDILATLNAVKALFSSENKPIFVDESASTLRMLLPLTLAINKPCKFISGTSLSKRPIKFLLDILTSAGAVCTTCYDENGSLNINIRGELQSDTYKLDTGISTQHISGFLFALPLLDKPGKLVVQGKYQERSYINITLNVIKKFGIHYNIEKFEDHYIINIDGKQTYTAPACNALSLAEPDFSNLTPWLVAKALGSDKLTLPKLPTASLQPDSIIMKIINAYDTMNNEEIHQKSNKEKSYVIDISQCLDLFPQLCVLAAFSNTKTLFTNIEKLKLKESDRIKSMQDILKKINIDTNISENTLLINGNPESTLQKPPTDILHLNSFGDHRIAMAAIILSGKLNVPIHLSGVNALEKSYPSFLEEFKSLGGKYDIYI